MGVLRQYNLMILIAVSGTITSFTACNESLPLRNDPVLPLTGNVESSISSVYKGDGVLLYPEITIYPKVKNVYDETLQGYGDFKGEINVTWERDTSYTKTFPLNKNSLMETRRYKYDPTQNVLTMDQGDEISFFYKWNFVADNGKRVDSNFVLGVDGSCWRIEYVSRSRFIPDRYAYIIWNPRKFSVERFIVSGYIKPFKDLAAVIIQPYVVTIEYETYKKGDCQSLPSPR
ncbi:MAG: hypothetical protein HUU02_12110 [Bacteroidetes bacterium]|nr:hypothetical protein [Bacteroidota bacterium]